MAGRVKSLMIAAGAALLAVPAAAQQGDWYAQGYGGAAFAMGNLNWDGSAFAMDTGFNAGGSVGRHLSPHWDVEVDVFYADMDYTCCSPNDISGLSAMINGIYDFETGWPVDPYFGAGLGAVRVHYDGIPAFTGTDWRFGYQVMAGVMADITPRFGIFTEYRFHDAAGRATLNSDVPISDVEYQSHNVSAGLQVSF